mmetsp:Transcript_13108/g.27730  ORF Transcript_13108/g.27730 Transcript_13108/m.27730 type:complete len:218 (-) Transcript_13108:672-1325(-)
MEGRVPVPRGAVVHSVQLRHGRVRSGRFGVDRRLRRQPEPERGDEARHRRLRERHPADPHHRVQPRREGGGAAAGVVPVRGVEDVRPPRGGQPAGHVARHRRFGPARGVLHCGCGEGGGVQAERRRVDPRGHPKGVHFRRLQPKRAPRAAGEHHAAGPARRHRRRRGGGERYEGAAGQPEPAHPHAEHRRKVHRGAARRAAAAGAGGEGARRGGARC